MANDNPITQGDGSGGTLAMDEKSFGGAAKKFQRVVLAAGETLAVSTVSQTTTGAVVLAASEGRVYAQVWPLDGDLYLADSVVELDSDSSRRKVTPTRPWETSHYVGDVAIKAVTGTVLVELEQVT